jgi:hypothetical protein
VTGGWRKVLIDEIRNLYYLDEQMMEDSNGHGM